MRLRFFVNSSTGIPHIYDHSVDEDEVEDVLKNRVFDSSARNDSRLAIGQTRGGRYLEIIYVRDSEPESFFVVTARELQGKALKAFKRLKRRKNK